VPQVVDSARAGEIKCRFSPGPESSMHPYPHLYTVSASAAPEGDVPVSAAGLPMLATAPPAEFDGPGDRWSPETLLVAAVADCFLLSFRGVARANKFAWTSLGCEVQGTLERLEGKTRFTRILVKAVLRVPAGTDEAKAVQLMQRAENVCLISNSLVAERHIEATVVAE
jgi:organic hydroperoxide reductase OsmC/OhrA